MAEYIITPDMTGYTTPSGTVTDSGSDLYGLTSWSVFTREVFQGWAAGTTGGSDPWVDKWMAYEFAAAQPCIKYRFNTYANEGPKDFKLQGWNGSSWDDLDSQSAKNYSGWSDTFTLAGGAQSYAKYRLLATAGNLVALPNYFSINELELIGEKTDIEVPSIDFGFNLQTPDFILSDFIVVPSMDFGFDLQSPSYSVGPISLVVPSMDFGFGLQSVATSLVPRSDIPSSIIYRCTLTGAPDGVDDVVLLIESFQSRLRSGSPSFLSVVVPDGETFAAVVASRPNGQIVLERGARFADGSMQLVEIARVNLEDPRDDGGGRSHSLTLSGHATTTTTVPKTITLSGATYRASGGGVRRFRADLDLNLRPGDTAVWDGESIVVGLITYIVNAKGETMEITEAS